MSMTREMPVQTTRYHFPLNRVAVIKRWEIRIGEKGRDWNPHPLLMGR